LSSIWEIKAPIPIISLDQASRCRGTKYDKLSEIQNKCKKIFEDALNKHTMTVHDIRLKQWALQTAYKLQLTNFKASDSWVNDCKQKHNIVSRKITTVTTEKKMASLPDSMVAAEGFVDETANILRHVGAEKGDMADQSGFEIETTHGRQHSYRGVKKEISLVEGTQNTTYRYTIMPTVSADGQLKSPLFIVSVMRDATGQFCPKVKEQLFSADNSFVTATKSGKMGSVEVQQWSEKVSTVTDEEDVEKVLIVDSSSGHNKLKDHAEHSSVGVCVIPPPPPPPPRVFLLHFFFFFVLKKIKIILRILKCGVLCIPPPPGRDIGLSASRCVWFPGLENLFSWVTQHYPTFWQ